MTFAGFLYAIGAAVVWGLVYAIDQKILRQTSPFLLLFIDSAATAILLLPAFLYRKGGLNFLSGYTAKTWCLIIVSLILAALANYFIFSSIQFIGASYASILEITYPLFVVLFCYIAFGTIPHSYILIGGVLILIGSSIIVVFSK